ncbi:TB2/DP1, HVA22 family-domain-containing protein [Boletus edulis]|uniref:Protein YOP1 n=1 Tax=Boletus edulis BED1 TaxID=1328754 RepID=A0AAD4C1Z3_BOLED|nr:TB2/DP1, HVA22 family-domain-containing protein [Boletus edulis]KAF8445780.1 TB2/DP1, HVA22 family-domain-containing protein [Boletus edulis BED1]
MFVSLISHILCAWFAFALPCYSTYKALTHSASPDTLQALATYWAVIGAFIAFEHTLGLFLSWLPFYWELRTIFLLYISLPQTSGSTYLYKTYLEPWFSKNEADFDVAMASANTNAIAFCRTRISALFDFVWSFVNKTPVSADGDPQEPAHPLAIPVDHIKGLWTAYGPSVLAAFAPKDTSDAHVSSTAHADVHQPYSTN